MRIAYLIAGAGGMYCGSCLRDNRLAATLIAQGRDVVLMPLYTPIRTDEVDVSEKHVYYGGINVYLQQKVALFRHLPRWATRVLDSPALLRRVMRFAGDTSLDKLGEMTISMLEGPRGAQRGALCGLIDGLRATKPDLVSLPNLMFLGAAEPIKAALNVPVLCALSGEDVFLDKLPESYRRQSLDLIRRHAEHVEAFVAPTKYYAAHAAAHFALPPDRVHVVRMGIESPDVDEAAEPNGPFTIGYLARVCPEKGLANLAEAFVHLREAGRSCRLRAAGYMGRSDRGYLTEIRKRLDKHGLAADFEYAGELDRTEKFEFLRTLHLMSVPTVYREAKGLFVLEAMACGVPVVQPRHGSFPEIVEATGGGLLYDPTDPGALAEGIGRLMDDPGLRKDLGARGRVAVRSSFTDEVMAREAWALYSRFGDRRAE